MGKMFRYFAFLYSNYEGDAGWDGHKLLFLFFFEKWYQYILIMKEMLAEMGKNCSSYFLLKNDIKIGQSCSNFVLCYVIWIWDGQKLLFLFFLKNVIKIGQSCSNVVLCYVIWIWNYICDFVFGKIASLYCMYNSHFSIKWVAKWPPSQVHKEAQISDLLKLRKTQNLWGILNK